MSELSVPARPSRPYTCHLAVQATLRDSDALGHTNHVVYLTWCEEVRTRYVVERRGWTDLVINGSFWVGAAIGAAASIVLLDPQYFAPDTGWRLAFFIGAALGVVIFLMRFWIPESPRWLMTHGRAAEARAILDDIDEGFRARGHSFDGGTLPLIRLVNAVEKRLRSGLVGIAGAGG